jgi:hypothetical protein
MIEYGEGQQALPQLLIMLKKNKVCHHTLIKGIFAIVIKVTNITVCS